MYGIRSRPLYGAAASFLLGELFSQMFPDMTGSVQVFIWLAVIVFGWLALEGWLMQYVLPSLPDRWMPANIRNKWRWLLYKPTVQITGDVQISENKPYSLYLVLDITSLNRYGKTVCDFSCAYVDLKQRKSIFRFYKRSVDPKIILDSMETESRSLMMFQLRNDCDDCDLTVNFPVTLKSISATIYDDGKEDGRGFVHNVKGARRLDAKRRM